VIRAATFDDAPGLARVHVQSWLETYTGLVPSEVLEGITVEAREAQWRRTFENDVGIFVAAINRQIVGFCSVGLRENEAELLTLYLVKAHQGAGIGQALWNRARDYATVRRAQTMLLWVLETNPTRGFYERQGGRLEGRKTEVLRGQELIEVSYRFQLH
jgi:GNAT superfamily N-acetyltransferase